MTKLHEVMLDLITSDTSVSDLVDLINKDNLYVKRDGSLLTRNQIYARVHQYPNLFYTKDGKIYKK